MNNFLAAFAILCVGVGLRAAGATGELWLAPNGSDANTGAIGAPLASLDAALEKSRGQSGPLRMVLRDGIYPLARPVAIQSSDNRPQNAAISIAAAPGEHPVLSGGVEIGRWEKPSQKISELPEIARGKVWSADAPKLGGHVLEFRQLWVNDIKAIRAREPNGENLARLVAWDKTNQVATIPAAALVGIKQTTRLEIVMDQVWEIAVLRVESIHIAGTNALLTFKQPESQIEFHHPWPPVIVNTNYRAPFFLANAIEFLDSPGEWFEDLPAGKIYYWPREGEDMMRAKAFAPRLETLVRIEGSPDQPVANIEFKGITFAHTTWMRPSQQGHVPLQAGMYLFDARRLPKVGQASRLPGEHVSASEPKIAPASPTQAGETPALLFQLAAKNPKLDNVGWIGRPPAAVAVKNAAHISFENCAFEHLASAGLDFESGTHDDLVQGCVFRDIGGNGIQLGKFSDTNVETHFPYNPSDEREICAGEKIADNVITDCANEDWGCVGIGVGYARDNSIEHNEICNLPYTGIGIGWGWTKMTNAMRNNLIFANHIHRVGQRLGDLGGIYTLSAQPGTVVAENSISEMTPSPFVPDPQHWFYLYLDEGSSGITVRDNWCPSEKFLKNANGPGNIWTNNGPQVSDKIKSAAGLTAAFQNLISK